MTPTYPAKLTVLYTVLPPLCQRNLHYHHILIQPTPFLLLGFLFHRRETGDNKNSLSSVKQGAQSKKEREEKQEACGIYLF